MGTKQVKRENDFGGILFYAKSSLFTTEDKGVFKVNNLRSELHRSGEMMSVAVEDGSSMIAGRMTSPPPGAPYRT